MINKIIIKNFKNSYIFIKSYIFIITNFTKIILFYFFIHSYKILFFTNVLPNPLLVVTLIQFGIVSWAANSGSLLTLSEVYWIGPDLGLTHRPPHFLHDSPNVSGQERNQLRYRWKP